MIEIIYRHSLYAMTIHNTSNCLPQCQEGSHSTPKGICVSLNYQCAIFEKTHLHVCTLPLEYPTLKLQSHVNIFMYGLIEKRFTSHYLNNTRQQLVNIQTH